MAWTKVIISSLLLAFVASAGAFEGCQVRFNKRSCQHRMLEGLVVHCDGGGMEQRVPFNLVQDTLYLSMSNFNFSRPLSSANFSRLTTVQCMAIISSRVAGITADAFSQFESLAELTLEGTVLDNTHLDFLKNPKFRPELFALTQSPNFVRLEALQGTTKNLQGLRTLQLSGNSLRSVAEEFFVDLKHLESLDLSFNQLTSLPWDMFNYLVRLKQLYLAGNRFQAIPDSMYPVFFAVKHLTLAQNPLHCNCRLTWLRDFYRRAADKNLDIEHMYCRGPKHSRITLDPPAPENFRCSVPNQPIITWSKMADGRFEMSCAAYGDPSPTLTMAIGYGARRIIIPPSDNLSQLNTSSPVMIVSPTFVSCEATNTQGESRIRERVGPFMGKH